MTYVSDQTPQELREHMRSLKKMRGWHDPLADRLFREVEALDAEVKQLRGWVSFWMPIETAPKDKTILITGRYANGRAYVEESYWHPHGHFNARQFDPPTHWMRMPEPNGGWDVAAR